MRKLTWTGSPPRRTVAHAAVRARPRRAAVALTLFLVAFTVAGCAKVSEFIPDGGDATVTSTPTATPAEPVRTGPILAPGGIGIGGSGNQQPVTIVPDHQLSPSVVQVQLLDTSGGVVRVARDGSGVVVDEERRLILTAYPLVHPYDAEARRAYTTIAIGTNRSAGGDPVLEYEAELVAADPSLHLAVLRVTRQFRGDPIGEGDFDLPAAVVGESGSIGSGAAVRLFAHPGLDVIDASTQALTATNASVMRLRGHPRTGSRSWLVVDARLPYGGAGAAVFERSGTLVGIGVQEAYDPGAPVAQVRPVELARDVIEQARTVSPSFEYRAVLVAQPPSTAGSPWVSRPVFAASAVEGHGDLFDYANTFPTTQSVIHYQFVAQGLPDRAVVEERWYLDEVLQDSLSSSYAWDRGVFGVVSDRIDFPNAIPAGTWRLEVWVDEQRLASGVAYVGQQPPSPALSSSLTFAGGVSRTGEPQTLTATSERVLAFFDYRGMTSANEIRWRVFRGGTLVHQSEAVPWPGADQGRWWVGYDHGQPIGAGQWEFEVLVDGVIAASDSVTP